MFSTFVTRLYKWHGPFSRQYLYSYVPTLRQAREHVWNLPQNRSLRPFARWNQTAQMLSGSYGTLGLCGWVAQWSGSAIDLSLHAAAMNLVLNAQEEAEFEDGNGTRSLRASHLPGYRRDCTNHCPSLPGYRSRRIGQMGRLVSITDYRA